MMLTISALKLNSYKKLQYDIQTEKQRYFLMLCYLPVV